VPIHSPFVGQHVLIRVEPAYAPSDEIQVFREDGAQAWVCTASATDSAVGASVTRQQVVSAQVEQREHAREIIRQARGVLQDAERETQLTESGDNATVPTSALQPTAPASPSEATPPIRPKERKPDLLDRLAGLDE
jgi:hypothetical protein